MIRWIVSVISLLLCFVATNSLAQSGTSDLNIFGYFQNSFQHQIETEKDSKENSFSVQQLNLFFQKDLAPDWRAFVNFEFLNSFSSSRQWGAANLEEAWVKYSANEKFNLKLGLLIPIFNNLNEIKNRTPILPYIVRPIVYETSFREFIDVDQYTPERAFAQAYGFIPVGEAKFDYAVYVGNSPNIASSDSIYKGQTGLDTTNTILLGGRIGLRYHDFKLGLSITRDNDKQLESTGVVLGGTR